MYMNILKELFFVFWFFAPAGLANIAAFSAGKIPVLKKYSYPVDFYKKYRGKRILGDHKTIRGFLAGIVVGIATVCLQIFLFQHVFMLRHVLPLNYNHVNPWILGTLAAFGALAGDSVKSLFKRRMNISPGKSWFPFDQIDYILGGIVFTVFYIKLNLFQYILLFILWFLLHPLTTFLGYLFKLKDEPV